MWAFCGAEHYVGECRRYIDGYDSNNRPTGESGFDINRWVWNRKKKVWKNLKNITIVTPSRWLAECAKTSVLFKGYRVEVIPNGIDTDIFKPMDKELARKKLNLPFDKKLILFGAMNAMSDLRKGFKYLEEALKNIKFEKKKDIEIVVFGSANSGDNNELLFPAHYLGNINDDKVLSMVYSAADVMVIPSIEDNLPNIIMESISCGTPCVGFNLGGIPDMIDHKVNGYLAKPLDSVDLAKGIEWILEDDARLLELSKNARIKVLEIFDMDIVARKYLSLYREIINKELC
jgi:glycosyltransferase involved in cell wall biosynthesis